MMLRPAVISELSMQLLSAHKSSQVVLTDKLIPVTQVGGDLAMAVDRAAFKQELLYQAENRWSSYARIDSGWAHQT